MTTASHVTEYVPAFALDCLDAEESRQVCEHLKCCPACRAELESYLAVVDQLALAAPDVEPPANVRQRLMDCLDRS